MFSKARLRKAYKDVFLSESGKLVLHDILKAGHIFKGIQGSDFKNGERNLALRVLTFTTFDEKDIVNLVKEAKQYTNIQDEFEE